jgi:transcriptional regulator with XRE-family HTH domain
MMRVMGTRERPADRGRRRAEDAFRRLGQEHRLARVSAGLSLREVGAASAASHQQLSRFERGELERVSVVELGAWCAVVGLDLAIRAYPAGDPIRDRAQLALIERLRARLHLSLQWRAEVPLPIEGDLRAWDAEIVGRHPAPWRARVEAETRIADGQALERRLGLKLRDDPTGHLILLVSDTRSNRRALASIGAGLDHMLPMRTRDMMAALTAGKDPGRGGIVIL